LRIARDGVVRYANQASAGLLASWQCAVGRQLPDAWRKIIRDSLLAKPFAPGMLAAKVREVLDRA